MSDASTNSSHPPSLDNNHSTVESSRPWTPPDRSALNVPDVYVFTPDNDPTPSCRICVYKADEPVSPPTPDLDKLHAALEQLTELTRDTPKFTRHNGKSLEDLVIMPKKKVVNQTAEVAPCTTPPVERKNSKRMSLASLKGVGSALKRKRTRPLSTPGTISSDKTLPSLPAEVSPVPEAEDYDLPRPSCRLVSCPWDPSDSDHVPFPTPTSPLDKDLPSLPEASNVRRSRRASFGEALKRRSLTSLSKAFKTSPQPLSQDVTNTQGIDSYSRKQNRTSTQSLPLKKGKKFKEYFVSSPQEDIPPVPPLPAWTGQPVSVQHISFSSQPPSPRISHPFPLQPSVTIFDTPPIGMPARPVTPEPLAPRRPQPIPSEEGSPEEPPPVLLARIRRVLQDMTPPKSPTSSPGTPKSLFRRLSLTSPRWSARSRRSTPTASPRIAEELREEEAEQAEDDIEEDWEEPTPPRQAVDLPMKLNSLHFSKLSFDADAF